MGRKNTKSKCLNCDKLFYPAVSEIKRGNGKFCSLSCVCHYRNKNYLIRTTKKETKTCLYCKKKFLHIPYKGLGKFCSKACFYSSKKGKQPWHPNQNVRRKLKEIAFDVYGYKCEICEYSITVDIHHLIPRSQNGSNNINNIAVLCPNHHREYHIGLLVKEDIYNLRNKSVEMEGYEPSSRKTIQKHLQA